MLRLRLSISVVACFLVWTVTCISTGSRQLPVPQTSHAPMVAAGLSTRMAAARKFISIRDAPNIPESELPEMLRRSFDPKSSNVDAAKEGSRRRKKWKQKRHHASSKVADSSPEVGKWKRAARRKDKLIDKWKQRYQEEKEKEKRDDTARERKEEYEHKIEQMYEGEPSESSRHVSDHAGERERPEFKDDLKKDREKASSNTVSRERERDLDLNFDRRNTAKSESEEETHTSNVVEKAAEAIRKDIGLKTNRDVEKAAETVRKEIATNGKSQPNDNNDVKKAAGTVRKEIATKERPKKNNDVKKAAEAVRKEIATEQVPKREAGKDAPTSKKDQPPESSNPAIFEVFWPPQPTQKAAPTSKKGEPPKSSQQPSEKEWHNIVTQVSQRERVPQSNVSHCGDGYVENLLPPCPESSIAKFRGLSQVLAKDVGGILGLVETAVLLGESAALDVSSCAIRRDKSASSRASEMPLRFILDTQYVNHPRCCQAGDINGLVEKESGGIAAWTKEALAAAVHHTAPSVGNISYLQVNPHEVFACRREYPCPMVMQLPAANGGLPWLLVQGHCQACQKELGSFLVAPHLPQDVLGPHGHPVGSSNTVIIDVLLPFVAHFLENHAEVDRERVYIAGIGLAADTAFRAALLGQNFFSMALLAGKWLVTSDTKAMRGRPPKLLRGTHRRLRSVQFHVGDMDDAYDNRFWNDLKNVLVPFKDDDKPLRLDLRVYSQSKHNIWYAAWNSLHEVIWSGQRGVASVLETVPATCDSIDGP